MKILGLRGYVLAIAAVSGMLSGCSGSQPQIGAPEAIPQSRTIAQHADRIKSWMLPEAKGEDLLYVSNYFNGTVNVYAYRSRHLVGILSGLNGPGGECSDKAGNIFITNVRGASIVEYAHGGTSPVATVNDPGYYPNDCSIDPTTGNLGVANLDGGPNPGNLAIYQKAQGNPAFYADRNPYVVYYYFCGYDADGNVFVDAGGDGGGPLNFDELPKGGKELSRLRFPHQIPVGGTLQWDGRYMTVGDGGNKMFRFSVGVDQGRVYRDGKIVLQGSLGISQIWILKLHGRQQAVGAANNANAVQFWSYPAGKPIHTINSGLDDPDGVTVSLAPH